MQLTPEVIIEQFETRRHEERAARKRKFWRRAVDIMRFAVAVIVIFALSDKSKPELLLAPTLVFLYLSHEVQRRWELEERLNRLENDKKA